MNAPLSLKTDTIDSFLVSSIALAQTCPPSEARRRFLKYYQNYKESFDHRLRSLYARQSKEVTDSILPGQTRILEVGCGCGTESLWFALRGAITTGIDLNTKRLAIARIRKHHIEKQLGRPLALTLKSHSLFDFCPEEPFDIIWLEQAFHHIEPRDEAIDKIVSLLKPGGKLIISESNALNPFIQVQLFKQRGFKTIRTRPGKDGIPVPYGNERILTANCLIQLFRKAGLGCEGVHYFRAFPSYPFFEKLFWLEKRLPQWLKPLFTHYNYMGIKPLQKESCDRKHKR